jgi:hypothetical protein
MNENSQQNIDDIDDLLVESIERLKNVLNGSIARRLRYAPIVFLRNLLLNDKLKGLEFDRNNEPRPPYVPADTAESQAILRPSMEIIGSQQGQAKYRISRRTRHAMATVVRERNLNQQQTAWMIDNYFIHELIHHDQGMGEGNHSQLSQHAPQVLLAIDYQADALAVVVATMLAWCEPFEFVQKHLDWFVSDEHGPMIEPIINHWTLYTYAIEAVLYQMEIFTSLSRRAMDRSTISAMTADLERIQRIALWHYQFHRAQQFNPSCPLADFQILAQPMLDFRNLAWASVHRAQYLTRDWPKSELDLLKEWERLTKEFQFGHVFNQTERPQQLIVTGISPYGSTRFVRHTAATQEDYQNAFLGFFELNTLASRDFFTTLFASQPWLIDRENGGNGGGDNDDEDGSPNPPDLRGNTENLAYDKGKEERFNILSQMMTPSSFFLTRMSAG